MIKGSTPQDNNKHIQQLNVQTPKVNIDTYEELNALHYNNTGLYHSHSDRRKPLTQKSNIEFKLHSRPSDLTNT